MDSSSVWSSDLAGGADTLVAVATPPGRGALAMIRISGPDATGIVARLCPGMKTERVQRAQLVTLRDPDGARVERGVAVRYRAPRSYTGEDMVELTVHGSPALVRRIVELLVKAGCRPAGPGELTRRAVANGRMDLLQAEAVADLIAAETAQQLELARRHLDGALSRRIQSLRKALVELLARLEAALDFTAQGVELDLGELLARRRAAVEQMTMLMETRRRGRLVRQGARVVLVGPPNAGKSTLFNRLLRSERSIVAPHPGTTRDFIEADVELGGLRVTLVDTAGVTAGAGDAVEREGVRRTLELARGADLLLVLEPVAGGGGPVEVPEGVARIEVRTKADLDPEGREDGEGIAVSAVTGVGLERLESRIVAELSDGHPAGEAEVAVNQRQAAALERAVTALEGAPLEQPELAAEDVRHAVRILGELVGEVTPEDVLDRVFSTFCLGK